MCGPLIVQTKNRVTYSPAIHIINISIYRAILRVWYNNRSIWYRGNIYPQIGPNDISRVYLLYLPPYHPLHNNNQLIIISRFPLCIGRRMFWSRAEQLLLPNQPINNNGLIITTYYCCSRLYSSNFIYKHTIQQFVFVEGCVSRVINQKYMKKSRSSTAVRAQQSQAQDRSPPKGAQQAVPPRVLN